MAGKRSLTTTNLENLGAATLAELLIEVSCGNAVIQRRLRLALAAAEGTEGAGQEVRKRLAAIARSTTFVDSRKRKALVLDLESQQRAITRTIAAADQNLAFELLLRFLELADGVMERCSDSTGTVVGVFERAGAELGALADATGVKPEALAEQVAELLAANSYGQFDQLIPTMKDSLGETGLRLLQNNQRINSGNHRHSQRQIAEALGDVEAYLGQFDDHQFSWPDTAAEVARQLLATGRPEQALTMLAKAAQAATSQQAPAWDEAHIAVLDALGRGEEAQQQRWNCFSSKLSIPHLRAYLQRLEAFEDVEAEERALMLAQEDPRPLLVLEFLVSWPALSRAARYVIENRRSWNGEAVEIYGPAAERLSAEHPIAASLLLRAMVVFTLATGRVKRYRHAAEQLSTCERLATRIDDWKDMETHASFMDRLQETRETKWTFWRWMQRQSAEHHEHKAQVNIKKR